MPPLPVVSGMEARRVFERLGWRYLRHHGSHMLLARKGHPALLSIPDKKTLGRGLLRSLIRDAELSVEEFVAALRK